MKDVMVQMRRFILPICMIAFIAVGVFGLADFTASAHGTQSLTCLSFSMAGSVACKDSSLDLLAVSMSMLMSLAYFAAVILALSSLLGVLQLRSFNRQRIRHRILVIPRALQEAFSRGRLHPKLF